MLSMTTSLMETVTTSNNTIHMTTTNSSLIEINSLLSPLSWFEIIAACTSYGLGFIGNLLSLIIFSSQDEFRKVSTGVLFLLMTISNTIHLWTLTTEFLGTFNVYIYSGGFLRCQLNYFIQNATRAVSTYLAVAAALDRLIRSEMPMRSRVICTRRNAMKLTLIYVIVFSILCSFWFCPLNTVNPITGICYIGQSPSYTYFYINIFLPVRFILVCVIPVVLMTSANIRMLLNLRQSRRRVAQDTQRNISSVAVDNVLMARRMTPLDRMLFYMMLGNVGTFIVTQIPFHTNAIVTAYHKDLNQVTYLLIRTIFLMWSSVYFGIGFYLYCVASPLFRKTLLKMMRYIFRRGMHD